MARLLLLMVMAFIVMAMSLVGCNSPSGKRHAMEEKFLVDTRMLSYLSDEELSIACLTRSHVYDSVTNSVFMYSSDSSMIGHYSRIPMGRHTHYKLVQVMWR